MRAFAFAFGLALACLLVKTADAGVSIQVDKSSQRMTVTTDSGERYVWPVSTGRSGYGTPAGSYRPQWMARKWFSRKYYNSPMPHSIFFHGGYAIHGTNYVSRLGGPASHGCVRLAPANAAKLFALVQREGMGNTRIAVTGGNLTHIARAPRPKARPMQQARVPQQPAPQVLQPIIAFQTAAAVPAQAPVIQQDQTRMAPRPAQVSQEHAALRQQQAQARQQQARMRQAQVRARQLEQAQARQVYQARVQQAQDLPTWFYPAATRVPSTALGYQAPAQPRVYRAPAHSGFYQAPIQPRSYPVQQYQYYGGRY
jgi:hypothetical protein